jgi:hypothetical protein
MVYYHDEISLIVPQAETIILNYVLIFITWQCLPKSVVLARCSSNLVCPHASCHAHFLKCQLSCKMHKIKNNSQSLGILKNTRIFDLSIFFR